MLEGSDNDQPLARPRGRSRKGVPSQVRRAGWAAIAAVRLRGRVGW